MADAFRYDKSAGILWLDDAYAVDLIYYPGSGNGDGYWKVGDRNDGDASTCIVNEDAALRAAQTRLQAAKESQTTHVDRAVAAMDAAMTAAGIATG